MNSFINHELLNRDYDLKATIIASIVLLSAEILCLFGIAVSGIIYTDGGGIDGRVIMNIPLIGFLILTPIVFGGLALVTYGHGSIHANYNILWVLILIIIEIILVITGVIPYE